MPLEPVTMVQEVVEAVAHLSCVCAAPIAPYSLMCREGAEARVMPATDPVAAVVVAG
jgi:hypothetical protein